MAEKSDVTVTRIGDKPVTDIDALIQQYGGQSAEQPAAAQPGQMDMMALIRQYGGQVDQGDQIPQREGLDLLSQYAGVVNRAVAPYATVAAGGAAVGGPFGAVVGPLALGATDLGATLANLGLQAAGSERRVPVPSDVIRSGYEAVLPTAFRQPETAGQRYLATGVEAATTAASQANALREIATKYGPGVARNVLAAMGKGPATQATAATGGATAQQALIETSEPESIQRNPLLVAVTGVLGSMAAGKVGVRGPQTIKDLIGKGTPTEEQLYREAKRKYREFDKAGVAFSGQAYDRMLSTLKQRLTDAGYTDQSAIKSVLNKMDKFAGQSRTLTDIDTTRSDVTKTLINSSDENVRRLGREIADEIDDFVGNASPNDIISGNLPKALANLGEARQLWTQVSRSEQMSELLRRAKLSDQPLDVAVRNEFRTLAKNPKRFNKFSPEERDFIQNVIEGGRVADALTNFSEALRVQRSLGGTLYAGAGGLATPFAAPIGQIEPFTAATIMAGVGGTRATTAALANRLAEQRVNLTGRVMRGFRPEPLTSLALPTGQAAVRPDVNFLSQSEVINALAGR
jgi:hypothetical protein